MTAFGLTGAKDSDFASRDEDDVLHDEEARDHADWSQIGKTGTVEEGSLEEEIWRELGALPRSSRLDLRS